MFGADRAEGGAIRVGGRGDADRRSPRTRSGPGSASCSEDRKLEGIVPGMSVRENLTLALLPQLARRGIVDEARQREIVDRFIERLGIKCAGPEQPIRELSGGNQQKVLLARWLCMNPRLLILDEPTRGIDVGAKAEILTLVRELAGAGLGRADDLLRAGGGGRRRPTASSCCATGARWPSSRARRSRSPP